MRCLKGRVIAFLSLKSGVILTKLPLGSVLLSLFFYGDAGSISELQILARRRMCT